MKLQTLETHEVAGRGTAHVVRLPPEVMESLGRFDSITGRVVELDGEQVKVTACEIPIHGDGMTAIIVERESEPLYRLFDVGER